ncbi:hypothetical protein LTR70_006548 [Exophiala xenobiotica]|uniref:Major facilitator superfamily (MFS) profile domain-containing protein n=1 Tax=Lithohypha guttulata TaxID=1690604 RepID=A0ABR0K769_9EURO|nr:hypothetical protein LTR24_006010 [Lithohypha guttulata]KAK5315906.1 hypothetical protein LTR70_006548 [Exophiala xenobiotica]
MVKSDGLGSGRNAPKLPKQQLAILALCRFAEPVAMTSVYPYIPEMIKSFNVPTVSVAKYAGLMSLVFSLSQALVGIWWGRASDKIGRKPTIMIALTCTMVSSILFGFSTSLPMAFVARSMQGLSNGNVGIIRTAVAELVPQKELQPRAFSLMPLVWTTGSIFGPSLGGSLVHPVERFPAIFGNVTLLERYPFALPNLLISFLFLIGITSGILFLRETLAEKKDRKDYGLIVGSAVIRPCTRRGRPAWYTRDAGESAEAFLGPHSTSNPSSPIEARKLPKPEPSGGWAQVFTYQSNLNLLVYTLLAMHSVSFDQLLPVFLDFSPVQTIDDPAVHLPLKFRGGFNLDSGRIGALFTMYGIVGMVIQFAIFPPMVRKWGVLNCYKIIAVVFPLVYVCMPYVSLLRTDAQRQGVLILLMLIKGFCSIFAFPCSTILLTNSAASLKILGTLNGVATSISALGRAAGPAIAGAAFSRGADKGYMILPWWTLAFISIIGAIPAWWLVEMDGFGGEEGDDDIAVDEESDDDLVVGAASPRLIAKKAAPVGIEVSPAAADDDLLPDNLPALAPTTSRSSAGAGRSRRESFSLRRMHSPVGMGEGLASGRQRRYSTDLGTTMSGFGTGGAPYQ